MTLAAATATHLDRITRTPGVCGGRPTVRGTRYSVEFVLSMLAEGMTPAEIVERYGEGLSVEDVQACVQAAYLSYARTEGDAERSPGRQSA